MGILTIKKGHTVYPVTPRKVVTGSIPGGRGGRKPKRVSDDALLEYVASHPYATPPQIAAGLERLGGLRYHPATVVKRLRKLGVPRQTLRRIQALARLVKGSPGTTQKEWATLLKVSINTIKRHIQAGQIPYQPKRGRPSSVDEAALVRHVEQSPHLTPRQLAILRLGKNPSTIRRHLRKRGMQSPDPFVLSRLAAHAGDLPPGTRRWVELAVERLLDGCVRRGESLEPRILASAEPYLWKAVEDLRIYRSYPLDYRELHPFIYALFGMRIPKDQTEKTYWSSPLTFQKRYTHLILAHSSKRHPLKPAREVADAKAKLITNAYLLLLKRRKWLNG